MALVPFPKKGPPAVPDDDLDPDRLDPDRDPDAGLDDDSTGGKMSFLDHLDELRSRIVYAVGSLFVAFVICFVFVGYIFDFIMRPLQQMLEPGQTLIYTEPGEAFFLHIKMALIAGLMIASPAIFTQLWLFIAPGLYAHEKKWAIPFVALSSLCFVGGAAFSHYVVFPLTWQFFAGFANDIVTFEPRIAPAFTYYFRMLLAFGIVFQMPVLVLFLARMGALTARFMIRNVKYAALAIVIISAVVTPDGGGVSLVAMALPLMVLYLFSIGLAWMFGKKKESIGS